MKYGYSESQGTSINFLEARHMSTTHFFIDIDSLTNEEQIKKLKIGQY
jgi:hypothetical protein